MAETLQRFFFRQLFLSVEEPDWWSFGSIIIYSLLNYLILSASAFVAAGVNVASAFCRNEAEMNLSGSDFFADEITTIRTNPGVMPASVPCGRIMIKMAFIVHSGEQRPSPVSVLIWLAMHHCLVVSLEESWWRILIKTFTAIRAPRAF